MVEKLIPHSYEKSKVKKSNFGFIFFERAEKRDLDIQETVSTFT